MHSRRYQANVFPVKYIPKDLHIYFKKYNSNPKGWEKQGDVYCQQLVEGRTMSLDSPTLSTDSKDWDKFLEVWKTLHSEDLIISRVYALYNPVLGNLNPV